MTDTYGDILYWERVDGILTDAEAERLMDAADRTARRMHPWDLICWIFKGCDQLEEAGLTASEEITLQVFMNVAESSGVLTRH